MVTRSFLLALICLGVVGCGGTDFGPTCMGGYWRTTKVGVLTAQANFIRDEQGRIIPCQDAPRNAKTTP